MSASRIELRPAAASDLAAIIALERAADALRAIDERRATGKIVLDVR